MHLPYLVIMSAIAFDALRSSKETTAGDSDLKECTSVGNAVATDSHPPSPGGQHVRNKAMRGGILNGVKLSFVCEKHLRA